MTKPSLCKALFLSLIFAAVPVGDALAQVNIGVDVMSRYVWRGADFGNSPSIQPGLNVSWSGFEAGAWAAMATNGNPDGTEIDFYGSYSIESSVGTFAVSITDYTFPEAPTGNYFTRDAHFVEGGIGYEGSRSLPISLFTGVFLTNDADHSVYTEIGYNADPIELFIGFTPTKSELYGTTGAGVINTGVTATHDLRVTDAFSLGLSVSLAANPYANDMFMMFGISL